MGKTRKANSHRDLIVYEKSRALSKEVFLASRNFPAEERYSLTDQVRRSTRSIGAQIAEAWAKRRYERHFISKLTDADGEQLESQHWIEVAQDCGYLSAKESESLIQSLNEIGRMLGAMIKKADSFCSNQAREAPPEYYS